MSESTVNRYFAIFSRIYNVYNVAIKRVRIRRPLQRAPRLKEAPHRTRRVYREDIDKLIRAFGFNLEKKMNRRQMAVLHFLIALKTAMRSGEVCSLTEETYFPDKCYVHLLRTKSGLACDVPPVQQGDGFDRNYKLQHPPITAQQVDVHCHKKGRGIEDLHFHDSRHEACTRLARKVGVMELARIVGHSNSKQTMVYDNPTAS